MFINIYTLCITIYIISHQCLIGQIRSYVFDCVRSHIPMLLIDEAFESKVSI